LNPVKKMARKAKSTTVKKIERLFTDNGNSEMSFGEIASSVGVGTNKLVGTLTSNPSLFQKTKTLRKCHDDTKVTVTFWRHIPERPVGIKEICEEYKLKTAELLPFVNMRTFEIRYKCWSAARNEDGKYNLQEVHNVIKKARRYGEI
jgi:hypothetical protein